MKMTCTHEHMINSMITCNSLIFINCSVHRFLLTARFRQKIQWTMTHCELCCLHVEIVRNHSIILN
jgi:hypothetical protein